MLGATNLAAPTESGHIVVNTKVPIPIRPPISCGHQIWPKMAMFRTLLMLIRRSCHWGPIIVLSFITIVTASSMFCLFQLAVLPKVVLFKDIPQRGLLLLDFPHYKELLPGSFMCYVRLFVYSWQMSCWVREWKSEVLSRGWDSDVGGGCIHSLKLVSMILYYRGKVAEHIRVWWSTPWHYNCDYYIITRLWKFPTALTNGTAPQPMQSPY